MCSCIIRLGLSVYTVAVQVSDGNQNYSLQVDMGSSDLVGVYPINRPPCAYCPSLSGLHQHLAHQLHAPVPRGVCTTLRFPVLGPVMTLALRTSLVMYLVPYTGIRCRSGGTTLAIRLLVRLSIIVPISLVDLF
jgi:hypothetical protein